MPFSSHQTTGTYCQHELPLQCLCQVSPWSELFPPPHLFHIILCLRSEGNAPLPWEWSLYKIIWNSACMICVFFPFIFSKYLFVPAWTCAYLFHILGYNPRLLCFSNYSSFGHPALGAGSCITLIYSYHCGVFDFDHFHTFLCYQMFHPHHIYFLP